MASPVKAFQDPTGLARLGDPLSLLLGPIEGRFHTAAQIPQRPFARVMVGPPVPLVQTHVPPQIQIPPPPMGRVVLSTFPPIYKERWATARPATGQIQPRGRS